MGSSRDRRFVNYIVVLGLDPGTLPGEASQVSVSANKAVALERFPTTDYADMPLTPMLTTLPDFCFQGSIRVDSHKPSDDSPAFLSFALTTGKGFRLHVCCLVIHETIQRSEPGSIYVPKALCVVSQLPCLDTFRRALADIAAAARHELEVPSTGYHSSLAQHLAAQILYEIPLPPCPRVQVVFCAGNRSSCILDQTFTRDFSFRPLLACLSAPRIAQLLLLVVLERKVVLTTKRLSLAFLSQTLEVLRALLFPFDWEHLYIPLLPPEMRWPLECPPPFLMGVPGGLDGVAVPDDVTVFDLDQDCTQPENPALLEHMAGLPPALEEPLLRLKHAFPWEQQPANQAYWSKSHLVRCPPATAVTAMAAAHSRSLESPLGERSDGEAPRTRRSPGRLPPGAGSASGSEASGCSSDSDGDMSVGGRSSHRPQLSEEQEGDFREKVAATVLEVFVVLLHAYPRFLRRHEASAGVRDRTAVRAPGEAGDGIFEAEAFLEHVRREAHGEEHAGFLREFLQTNSWERFLELPPEHPRTQLFGEALAVHNAWSQDASPLKRPLGDALRSWVAQQYEPLHSFAAPGRGVPLRARKKKPKCEQAEPLDLMAFQLSPGSVTPLPSPPCPAPQEIESWEIPTDAVHTFASAMFPALTTLSQLRTEPEQEAPAAQFLLLHLLHLLCDCNLALHSGTAAKPHTELPEGHATRPAPLVLAPRCEELTGGRPDSSLEALDPKELTAEVPRGDSLRMRPSCLLRSVRDLLEPCPVCSWRGCIWDAFAHSIANVDSRTGYTSMACKVCSNTWEPKFLVARRNRKGETSPEETLRTPLLTVAECLSRIGRGRLELAEPAVLMDTDSEVFWCLHFFFGLRVELFEVASDGAPTRQGFATFESLCKAYCHDRQQATALALASHSQDVSPEPTAGAAEQRFQQASELDGDSSPSMVSSATEADPASPKECTARAESGDPTPPTPQAGGSVDNLSPTFARGEGDQGSGESTASIEQGLNMTGQDSQPGQNSPQWPPVIQVSLSPSRPPALSERLRCLAALHPRLVAGSNHNSGSLRLELLERAEALLSARKEEAEASESESLSKRAGPALRPVPAPASPTASARSPSEQGAPVVDLLRHPRLPRSLLRRSPRVDHRKQDRDLQPSWTRHGQHTPHRVATPPRRGEGFTSLRRLKQAQSPLGIARTPDSGGTTVEAGARPPLSARSRYSSKQPVLSAVDRRVTPSPGRRPSSGCKRLVQQQESMRPEQGEPCMARVAAATREGQCEDREEREEEMEVKLEGEECRLLQEIEGLTGRLSELELEVELRSGLRVQAPWAMAEVHSFSTAPVPGAAAPTPGVFRWSAAARARACLKTSEWEGQGCQVLASAWTSRGSSPSPGRG